MDLAKFSRVLMKGKGVGMQTWGNFPELSVWGVD